MPRTSFDVRDARGVRRKDVGDEFDTFEGARKQCQGLLPDIARAELPDGDLHTIRCDVRDEAERIVCRGEFTFQGTRAPT